MNCSKCKSETMLVTVPDTNKEDRQFWVCVKCKKIFDEMQKEVSKKQQIEYGLDNIFVNM